MSRKDTIIFAVVINVGLLIFLFTTAMRTTEETVIAVQQPEVLKVEPPIQAPSGTTLANQEFPRGDMDYLLNQLPQQSISQVEKESTDPLVTEQRNIINEHLENKTTQFVDVTVKRGDVLERIARANGVTVEEIMEVNNLHDTRLQIGQVLKIPLKLALASNVNSPEPSKQQVEEESTYIVRSGDNPWVIAMRHRMNLDELLQMNGLNEETARRLKPGDRLKVR